MNGEAICLNKKCNKVIETFLFSEPLKGSQDKPSTADENTISKPMDLRNQTPMNDNVTLMDELGLLSGEEQSSSKTTNKVSSSIQIIKETSDQVTSPIEIISTNLAISKMWMTRFQRTLTSIGCQNIFDSSRKVSAFVI